MTEHREAADRSVKSTERGRSSVSPGGEWGDDGPVSVRVVQALAEVKGVSPLDLEEPLYNVVDLEALDGLFGPAAAAGDRRGRVVFTVDGCEVTVTASRDVYVREVE